MRWTLSLVSLSLCSSQGVFESSMELWRRERWRDFFFMVTFYLLNMKFFNIYEMTLLLFQHSDNGLYVRNLCS